MIEHRRFSRFIHQLPVKISQGDVNLVGTLQDISLNGLFVHLDSSEQLDKDQHLDIRFTFEGSDDEIAISAEVIVFDPQALRLKINAIDIDSICHLKRFVELNVGSDTLLNRELEHLSDVGA